MSVKIEMHQNGEVLSSKIFQSVIQNDAKLTYTKVQEELDQSTIVNPLGAHMRTTLNILAELATNKRKLRLGLGMNSVESVKNSKAQFLVEEFMIEANKQVAEYLDTKYHHGFPLRVQDEPNPAKLLMWQGKHAATSLYSLYFEKINTKNPSDSPLNTVPFLANVLQKCSSLLQCGDVQGIINHLGLKTLNPRFALDMTSWFEIQNKAEYKRQTENVPVRHFSLGLEHYTHFTSPIRRYIDIVIHRLIKTALGNKDSLYSDREIDKICEEINSRMKVGKSFDKKSCLLDDIHHLVKKPVYFLGFIQQVDDGGIELLFPGLPHTDKQHRSIRFPHLGVCSKPDLSDDGAAATLEWQRKIFDVNPFCSHARTLRDIWHKVKLDSSMYIKHIDTDEWQRFLTMIISDTSEEDKKNVLSDMLSRTFFSKQSSQEVTSEMKYPEKLVRHHCDFSYELQTTGVVAVQMTVKSSEGLLQPYPQLLQLTPQVHLCLEHRKDPVCCFSEIARKPSQKRYRNETEYMEIWQPIIAMETATCSISDSDPIMVHNVLVKLEKGYNVTYGELTLDRDFCRTRYIEVFKTPPAIHSADHSSLIIFSIYYKLPTGK